MRQHANVSDVLWVLVQAGQLSWRVLPAHIFNATPRRKEILEKALLKPIQTNLFGMRSALLKSMRASVQRNGFAIAPGFFSASEIQVVKDEMRSLVRRQRDELLGSSSVFTTVKQEKTTDHYFMSSGDRISFFWEDGVKPNAEGQGLNKVGHNLHNLNAVFRSFCYQPRLAQLAQQFFADPRIVQTMYIMKSQKVGGEVSPHQDNAFLMTEPLSIHGFWIALDDAKVDNGCLWAVPGSHLDPPTHFFRALPDRSKAVWDAGYDSKKLHALLPKGVPLEAPKGTLVVLHGNLVHYSQKNTSDKPREALTLHIAEGKFPWRSDNWLLPTPPGGFESMV